MKTLTAFYDLDVGPVSYDFIVFLVKAEMERRRANADNLHVVLVPGVGPGGMRDKSAFYDQHEARWRLHNICIPACALADATHTLAIGWAQAEVLGKQSAFTWPRDWDHQTLRNRSHLIGDAIHAARAGERIPMLSASVHARRTVKELWAGRRVVTMTRRSTYLPDRNTDGAAWTEAEYQIESAGFLVERIEDVGRAMKFGGGFAELSIDLRLAMYQEAEMNFVANCGPSSLCWFSEKPYRMFDAGVGETEQEWRGLFVEQGLPWGATWPWAMPQQKIIYERSTAEVLIREFEQWAGATKS